jgi:rhodanese-related sulfurtransferase
MGQIFFEDTNTNHFTFIDCRNAQAFCNGHYKGALFAGDDEATEERIAVIENIPPDACFIVNNIDASNWSGKKMLLKSSDFFVWDDAVKIPSEKLDMCIELDLEEFLLDYQYDEFFLIDVRTTEDFQKGSIEHAQSIPLEDIMQSIIDLEPNVPYYIFSNSFENAVFAASIFKQNGFNLVRVVSANYDEIAAALKKK